MSIKKAWMVIDASTDKMAGAALWVSVLSLTIIMLLAFVDIITTKFFNHPIPSTIELIECLDIPLVFMGMAYVQLTRGHMAGPVFESHFSEGVNRSIVLIGNILGFVVSVLISWKTIEIFQDAFTLSKVKGVTFEFPLWPFSLLTVIGFALLALAFIVSSVRTIIKADQHPSKS